MRKVLISKYTLLLNNEYYFPLLQSTYRLLVAATMSKDKYQVSWCLPFLHTRNYWHGKKVKAASGSLSFDNFFVLKIRYLKSCHYRMLDPIDIAVVKVACFCTKKNSQYFQVFDYNSKWNLIDTQLWSCVSVPLCILGACF